MSSILFVTNVDYRYYDNNRVHHFVEHFQNWFDHVYLMYTRQYVPGRFSAVSRIVGFFTFMTKRFKSGTVDCIEVDPLLNRVGGLALSLLQVKDPYEVPSLRVTGLLRRLLSPVGFLTELGIVPSLLIAYGLHVRKKVDIVVGQTPWEMAFGIVLTRCGLANMVVYDDFDYAPGTVPVEGMRRKLIATVEKFCLRHSDLVISVGQLMGNLREQQTGKNVCVIPNGVDYELFQRAQKKLAHPPTLVYTGFVYEYAGLDIIFRSLVQVRERIPAIRLLIIGHTVPEYLDALIKLRSELGLNECIDYVGKLSYADLVPHLQIADIGLALSKPIPLRKYAFPLKVVEYFAAGLPVVTTRGLQGAQVVEEARAGLAVDYSITAVTEALIKILEDKDQYREYSQNAVLAASDYSWQELTRRAYEVIEAHYTEKVTNRKTS